MRIFKMAARQAQLLLLEVEQLHLQQPEPVLDSRPEMVCFRGQSLALVRHFFELSCQMGRLPSLLGREFFRAKISHHSVPSFEDQIVFARDVEICMEKLSDEHAEIITLVGLYDFSHDEVAEMLRCARTSVTELFPAALDALSEIFLQAGLLSETRPDRHQHQ
jgi:DNA-directed RNA polymerase specialized sigma24 family protein